MRGNWKVSTVMVACLLAMAAIEVGQQTGAELSKATKGSEAKRKASAVATDQVKLVKLTVHTTHDDKDDALSWLIEIMEGNNVYGSVEVGSGEVWKNDAATDIAIKLDHTFAYPNRQTGKISVTQKSSGKNYRWEGILSVDGVLGDESTKKLINRTREFKLGENGNPRAVEFYFD